MAKRWKDLERATAAALGGKRVGVTGLSTPDVVIAGSEHLRIECKAYSRFAHHSLMETIKKKYCKSNEDIPILVTKHSSQRGAYATVPLDFLAELLKESNDDMYTV